MPNIICEELVFKDGKVDIVEQEFSKLWNDKIQRLEAENKKLKGENGKLEEQVKKQQERAEKFRVRNCDRMEEYVKALSPWKKNHGDHKSILEAIRELKEENETLKDANLSSLLSERALLKEIKELKEEIVKGVAAVETKI